MPSMPADGPTDERDAGAVEVGGAVAVHVHAEPSTTHQLHPVADGLPLAIPTAALDGTDDVVAIEVDAPTACRERHHSQRPG